MSEMKTEGTSTKYSIFQLHGQSRTAGNSGFALWGLTCFVETFVVKQTFELRMNSSVKNPPQRKAANR